MRGVPRHCGLLALALLTVACSRAPKKGDLVRSEARGSSTCRATCRKAGWVPVDLYREWRGEPVLVASNIEDKQFYEPDRIDLQYGSGKAKIWLERVHGVRLAAVTIQRVFRDLGVPRLR